MNLLLLVFFTTINRLAFRKLWKRKIQRLKREHSEEFMWLVNWEDQTEFLVDIGAEITSISVKISEYSGVAVRDKFEWISTMKVTNEAFSEFKKVGFVPHLGKRALSTKGSLGCSILTAVVDMMQFRPTRTFRIIFTGGR